VDWKATQHADPEIGKIQDNLTQNKQLIANEFHIRGNNKRSFFFVSMAKLYVS
jgi:hypothetical protein